MEIFTRTCITAAGGQFDIERCTLKITPSRFHTEVFKTVARHRQVQISRTKKMSVHRNRKRNLLVQYIETDKPHKDVCAASGLSSSSPAHKFAGPATRPDRLRVKAPIHLHCIRRWSRTRLRFCRCVCKRPKEQRPELERDRGRDKAVITKGYWICGVIVEGRMLPYVCSDMCVQISIWKFSSLLEIIWHNVNVSIQA